MPVRSKLYDRLRLLESIVERVIANARRAVNNDLPMDAYASAEFTLLELQVPPDPARGLNTDVGARSYCKPRSSGRSG